MIKMIKMDVNTIYWTTTVIMWISIIYVFLTRRKLANKYSKQYDDFVGRTKKEYDEFVEHYAERLNLLSKENNKLRTENEELKDRLRNLGIKDLDV